MNIAICEDNLDDAKLICDILKNHLETNSYLGNIYTFKSGEELLESFSLGAFDAVFLDIYMDGITGVETAKKMREIDPYFALVFITSSELHAIEAFSVYACAYVLKPITQKGMETAFSQCKSVFMKNARFIQIRSERQDLKIPINKIIYAEVYDKHILIYTDAAVVKAYKPLDELEKELGKSFLRCHRSYLINMNYIDRILDKDILMKNGNIIPMRQRGSTKTRDIYGRFISDILFEVD